MAERSADTHAAFFLPHIMPGDDLLDCGCGPGTITLGLAEAVFPGHVTGLDIEPSQLELAERLAWGREIMNTRFLRGNAYELPFRDGRFDLVFSHALLEHLSDPQAALREMARVLKPGGTIGVCLPDWDQFEFHPFPTEVRNAIALYRGIQEENGGTTNGGTKLCNWLEASGFTAVKMSAYFERYESPRRFAEFLAFQLRREGYAKAGAQLIEWSLGTNAALAQAWCSGIAKRER